MKNVRTEMKNHIDMTKRGKIPLAAMAMAFALVAAFALLGCKSNAIGDSDASGDGTGSLAVAIADAASVRLVMPSLPTAETVKGYEISLSREGYATRSSGRVTDLSSFTMQALEAGDWTLALSGFDASGTKIAEGKTTVTIERDKTITATVALTPAFARTSGGTGTVSLVFACSGFNAADAGWTVGFTPSAGGTPVSFTRASASGVTVDTGANTIALSATLASGDWDMTFSVTYKGTAYVAASDVVKVYDGKASVTATGASIAITLADLVKADRVLYVSDATTAGNSGRDRAHACRFTEALDAFNARTDLTEADPGVIILTTNVVYAVTGEPSDVINIRKPMKIMSLESASSPFSISHNKAGSNALIQVDHQEPSFTGSLTLEKVIVQPGGSWGYPYGLVQVSSAVSLGTLTLEKGAVIKGNQAGQMAGGVFLVSGRLVMNAGSEISGNKADYGAGVNSSDVADEIVMNGGTITGNTAKIAGGGLYAANENAKVTLNGGSITGNASKNGGTGVIGPGAGVCLMGENPGSLSCAVSGGWSAVVYGNSGIGPDLVRRFQVGEPPQLKAAIANQHLEPVWVDVTTPFEATGMGNATLYDGNKVVIFSVSSSSFNTGGMSVPLISVPSTTSLWFNATFSGDPDTSAPVISVTGGTLVLEAECSISSSGISTNPTGGAIYANAGSVEMRGGVIKNCRARWGGAVYATNTATFTMTGGMISTNNAEYGGAVYLAGKAKMTMSGNAAMEYNAATYYTGGIVATDTAELTILGTAPRIVNNDGGDARFGGNGVLLQKPTVKFSMPDTTWQTVIKANIPNDLPSLTRVIPVADEDGIVSALADPSIPVLIDIPSSTIPVTRTHHITGTVLMRAQGVKSKLLRDPAFPDVLLSVDPGASLIFNGGVTVDGNSSSITANAPLIDVKSGGVLNVRFTDTVLQNATNTGLGGAVYVAGSFLSKGIIGVDGSGNRAHQGGGVYVADGGSMTMTDGAVSYNTSANEGGGIYVDSTGTLTYTGGTIEGNATELLETGGGGIFLDGTLNLGSIVAGIKTNNDYGLQVTISGILQLDRGSGFEVLLHEDAPFDEDFTGAIGVNTPVGFQIDGL